MTAAPDDHHAEPHGGRRDQSGRGEGSDRRNRLDLDPDTVERDLVKLVLTVVELLRQLMERQALRRFDEGDLTEEQEERIGLTLMLLGDRMAELRDRYGLRPEDLNLDLGPLGPLLPRD
ncbi:gas vesicle protein K [Streptomyces sp. NPDC085927]|uniref:gas vesicle protein K n=1 Tax=Streptomyces sp. NPDC085927 TaxID=3365738 RepID=UPI0037D88694